MRTPETTSRTENAQKVVLYAELVEEEKVEDLEQNVKQELIKEVATSGRKKFRT